MVPVWALVVVADGTNGANWGRSGAPASPVRCAGVACPVRRRRRSGACLARRRRRIGAPGSPGRRAGIVGPMRQRRRTGAPALPFRRLSSTPALPDQCVGVAILTRRCYLSGASRRVSVTFLAPAGASALPFRRQPARWRCLYGRPAAPVRRADGDSPLPRWHLSSALEVPHVPSSGDSTPNS